MGGFVLLLALLRRETMPAGESGSEAVRLLFRDLCWLATQPESPERDHIVEVISGLLHLSGESIRGVGPAPVVFPDPPPLVNLDEMRDLTGKWKEIAFHGTPRGKSILDALWDQTREFLLDSRTRPPSDSRVVSVGGRVFVNTEGLKPPPSLADVPLVINLSEMFKDEPPTSLVCQKARIGADPGLQFDQQYQCGYFGEDESAERRVAREAAYRAVESYYMQTELYDRSVCTGGIGPDGGAMPRAGTGERVRIEGNARHLFSKMLTAISSTGYPFTDAEIRAIMSDVCHNGEWRKKIESIPPGETPEKE